MEQGLSNTEFIELSGIQDGIGGSRSRSSKKIMVIATNIVLAMIGSYIGAKTWYLIACKKLYQHLLHFSQTIKSMSEFVT